MTRPGALLLAPGAGSSSEHPSLRAIEAAVAPLPVARMDFPYRKAGRKAPDRTPVLLAAVVGGAAIPALGVYGAELFPTGNRGKASGLIAMLSLVGSSIGLLGAGWALDQAFGYGAVMAILAIGPLVVAALVVIIYPETAHHELEDLNPEDRMDGLVPSEASQPAGHG